jgi:hypothetical protein
MSKVAELKSLHVKDYVYNPGVIYKGVNEPSLGEPGLFRLGSFIFGPDSSSSRAWVGCSSSARQGLNRARARARLDRV